MTGISRCPPGLAEKQASRSLNYHRSYVVLTQPGAELCWWLAFFKHDQTLSEGKIPRYTVDDHKDILQKYGNDKVGSTTLNQLYETAHHKVLVPIEEFVLDEWFLGRVVLLGDACHKVHPIIGQGANQAIESAACLADLIHSIRSTTDSATIHAAFSEYYITRHPRALSVMNAGRFSQCVDSLDTWWFKLFAFHVGTKTPIQNGFLPSFASGMLPAVSVRGLPQPDHGGNMPYEDQLRIKPSPRLKSATITFASVVLLAPSLSLYARYSGVHDERSFHSAVHNVAINSLWVIESYRVNVALSPLMR
jgi:FAD binding domain